MASFEKSNNGKWSVRFRVVELGECIQKRLSGFNLKREAESAYQDYMSTFKATAEPAKTTFDVLFSAYKKTLVGSVKDSTYISNESIIRCQIIPYFGKMIVEKVSVSDIQIWKKKIEHLSYNYKSKLFVMLGTLFSFANKYFDIVNKAYIKVPNFKDTKVHNFDYWTKDEFNQFISVVDDNLLKTLYSFLYYTGCRKGEAIGLHWKNVNFKSNTIKIENAVTYKTLTGVFAETLPKTKNSIRTIYINTKLMEMLKNIHVNTNPNDFVFGGQYPIAPETLRRNFFEYTEKAKVKRIKIHDLRHSHASLLISNGDGELATAYTIASRLGHKVEETFETYGHLFPSAQRKLIEKLDD